MTDQDVEDTVMEPDDGRLRIGQPTNKLADQAYQSLSDMIRKRSLRVGDALIEQEIAEFLGISRTPLREAMQRLEAEGLLRKGGRSYHVRKVDLKEYLQSLRVREVVESEAAALAVEHVNRSAIEEARKATRELEATTPYDKLLHWSVDDMVHRLFIDNCGNDVMTRLLLSLRVTTQLFEIERLADRLGPDSREHERIMDALWERDARAARKAVAVHIRSLFAFALRTIR